VYFGGSTRHVSEVGERHDLNDQVGIAERDKDRYVYRRLGYTRVLRAVDEAYIRERNDPAHDYRPDAEKYRPPIEHQGIDDPIQEKASTVHYFHSGKWFELQGAD
jgi:hypothetical protein